MKKNQYYQKIKGIMILIVIFTHCFLTVEQQLTTNMLIAIKRSIYYATPSFIFLSALFIKKEDTISFYKKKALRIIPPLIIWFLIYKIYYSITKQPIMIQQNNPHLYYLIVLIQLYLLTPIIIKHIDNSKTKISLYHPFIISFFADFLFLLFSFKYKNAFPYIEFYFFSWFDYYYLGLLISKQKINLSLKKSTYFLLWIGTMILSIITGIIINKEYNLLMQIIQQQNITICLFSLLLCLFIKKSETKTNESIITKIGDYSFGIYLSHFLIMKLVYLIIPQNNNCLIQLITLYLITTFLSIILNYIYYKTKKWIKQ